MGKIVKNRFVIEDPSGFISSVTVDYILRGRQRKADGSFDPPSALGKTGTITDERYSYTGVLNDDFHVHFTEKYLTYDADAKAFVSSSPMKYDFLRAIIKTRNGKSTTEYHATISNRTDNSYKFLKNQKSRFLI